MGILALVVVAAVGKSIVTGSCLELWVFRMGSCAGITLQELNDRLAKLPPGRDGITLQELNDRLAKLPAGRDGAPTVPGLLLIAAGEVDANCKTIKNVGPYTFLPPVHSGAGECELKFERNRPEKPFYLVGPIAEKGTLASVVLTKRDPEGFAIHGGTQRLGGISFSRADIGFWFLAIELP
jgi:hypothetical protein